MLVFIDETWTKTNMTRPEGRSERGKRLVGAVPFGKWQTSTFIAGLRQDGMIAPGVFEGAINGEMFLAYVEQNLTRDLRKGDVVIMDKSRFAQGRWRARGDRGSGRHAALFAGIQPGFEPHRDGVRQAEGALARQGAAHGRRVMEGARRPRRLLQRGRVR